MSAAIEVLSIRELDGKSSVKAFVDLRCGGITLKGCKVVRQEGQAAWLAMPSLKTDHGWQNIVEVSKPLRQKLTEIAVSAWEARQNSQTQVHRVERSRDPREEYAEKVGAGFKPHTGVFRFEPAYGTGGASLRQSRLAGAPLQSGRRQDPDPWKHGRSARPPIRA